MRTLVLASTLTSLGGDAWWFYNITSNTIASIALALFSMQKPNKKFESLTKINLFQLSLATF